MIKKRMPSAISKKVTWMACVPYSTRSAGTVTPLANFDHIGFVPGFVTIVHYLPLYDIAIALQVNTDDLRGEITLQDFFNDLKIVVLAKEFK